MTSLFFLPKRFSRISDNEIEKSLSIIFTTVSIVPINENKISKALKHLSHILRYTENERILNLDSRKIIQSSIKILFFYDQQVHHSKPGLCKSKKNKKYEYCARTCYQHLVQVFAVKTPEKTVNTVIDILSKENFWELEDLCEIIIKDLIQAGISGSIVLNLLINRAENNKTISDDARKMIRVLYEILEDYSWPDNSETVYSIEKLLDIYHSSTNLPQTKNKNNKHVILKKGLEICIRNAINNLPNHHILPIIYHMCLWTIKAGTNNEIIYEFARTLEYAANVYKTDKLNVTLYQELFNLLMTMISSKNRLVSLLGNRIFQYLIDRKRNRLEFERIGIFFENINYNNIALNKCNKSDGEFLKENREILHNSFVNSLLNHCSSKLSLEATYCSICLLAVEVPCGFTAAALSCLVMKFQDLMVKHPEIPREISYHVHAMIISILSLICWIHRAKVFYSYVNKIMMKRAQYAPHLNPPLSTKYDFAIHHVLWDKPDLFFVDWEIRYGLWKCFRLCYT